MIYYISDLHFGSKKMKKHTNMRGFSNIDEMNSYMIEKWNSRVTEDDDVIILGDFCITTYGDDAEAILKQLKGRKYLIKGNWDRYLEDESFDQSLFGWVDNYREMSDGENDVVLSHYPVFCYNGQYRFHENGDPKTYMLYGHVHDTFDEYVVNEFIQATKNKKREIIGKEGLSNIPCQMINCFCVFSDYVPLTLEEWAKVDEERRQKMGEMK